MFENLEREKNIVFEVNQTASYVRVAVMKMLKDVGVTDITHEQFGILFILTKEDGLYQRQIAFLLSKDRPNITRMLDILEKKEFINREKHPDNRRISKVYITETGRKLVERLTPCKEKFREKIEKNIPKEDLEICLSVLKKIRDNIGDSCTLQI